MFTTAGRLALMGKITESGASEWWKLADVYQRQFPRTRTAGQCAGWLPINTTWPLVNRRLRMQAIRRVHLEGSLSQI